LLHADKHVLIPQGFLPGHLNALSSSCDAVLGEDGCATLPLSCAGSERTPLQPLDPRRGRVDLYTSGSSGAPKCVTKGLLQLQAEIDVLEACWGSLLGNATMVATVPHHHIYGMLFRILWPLCAGRAFDAGITTEPAALLDRLQQTEEAALVSSPAHLARLPELIDLDALAPTTRCVFSSGAPLPRQVAQVFARRLGNAPIEVYGSTETGGIAWRRQGADPHSIRWSPLPGVEVRVTEGALCLRRPFLGDAGWTRLEDAAELLADGRFLLNGRLDRIAKVEGKRVSLPEVEQRLREHPWIADAAVVRLSGSKDTLGAAVVLQAAAQSRLQSEGLPRLTIDLRAFLQNWFEPVLIPRRWRFLDRLPVNERGKVAAAELARLFQRAAE
jgi:acyl-coenzyme A synthetase/AMP-(fatty) acid ligase